MTKLIRIMFVAALVLGGGFAGAGGALAQVQEDVDNEAEVEQNGSSASGDAVAGQVVGIVSSGDASVDARNRSEDVDVETGQATAANAASANVGLFVEFVDNTEAAQFDVDNEADISQTADASSGDGVGGQVIGVVTSAGGSADIVADNTSLDVDIETGVAEATNTGFAGAGLAVFDASTVTATQDDVDNEASVDQAADASSGDGVGGQVIGVVSAGDASVDARNHSEDVDIETGFAEAANDGFAGTGLEVGFASTVTATQTDVNNEASLDQTADASSGDGVGGQVIGVVTSAGGSADVVAENTSLDVDVETGEALAFNEGSASAGLAAFGASTVTATQDDVDNEASVDQTAAASSGDGVGGQVIGVVSAGDASIDARNRSEDVDIETGVAEAGNSAFLTFAGLTVGGASDVDAFQIDVDNEVGIGQTADASSGDAVGGQVVGVVTSAGGSADAVLDNTSLDVDAESGVATHFNDADFAFVGMPFGSFAF